MNIDESCPFFEYIEVHESGCWLWKGEINRNGYGTFRKTISRGKRKRFMAHIEMYVWAKGDYDRSLFLDHDCKTRSCCNPDHVEPVTPQVNTIRGDAILFKPAGHYEQVQ